MATLKIKFNCMCLFVTGEQPGTVHVLLPNTAGHVPHAAHLLYRDRQGNTQRPSIKGWALDIESARFSALPAGVMSLLDKPDIVDLSEITGEHIDPKFLQTQPGDPVVSRITLHGGGVIDTEADDENQWSLGGENHVMAHQVTWQIETVSDQLRWSPLGVPENGTPLDTLANVEPDSDVQGVKSYTLWIYHVLPVDVPTQLPPPEEGTRTLQPEMVSHHFLAFYPLLQVTPTPQLKPTIVQTIGPPSGMEYCKTAKGRL